MSSSRRMNPWDSPEQDDELFKQQKELFRMRQEVFKSQQELFKIQCQKIARLTDNIASFQKIKGKALSYRTTTLNAGPVRKSDRETENTKKRIAEITNEQRDQFQALSKDDQRKMCKVAGLEFLMRAYATVDEALPKADETKTSDKSEILPDKGSTEISRQAELEADETKTLDKSEVLPDKSNTEISGQAEPEADELKTSDKSLKTSDKSEVLPDKRNTEISRQAELKTSEKSEVLPDEGNTETDEQAERSGSERDPIPQSDDQTKISDTGEKTPQVPEKQKGTQGEGAGTVLIPHKRVEALRSSAKPQPKAKPKSKAKSKPKAKPQPKAKHQPEANSSEPPSQQGPLPPHLGDLESPAQRLSAAQIETALKWNRERQTVLAAKLIKSKNDILQMQEDIREYEEKEGSILPKADVDIEQFLREREKVMREVVGK